MFECKANHTLRPHQSQLEQLKKKKKKKASFTVCRYLGGRLASLLVETLLEMIWATAQMEETVSETDGGWKKGGRG